MSKSTGRKVRVVRVDELDAAKRKYPEVPLPLEVYPPRYQKMVQRVAKALSVPPQMVAGPQLAVLGAALGNSITVTPTAGYDVSPFIWHILVAPTGEAKTPCIKWAVEPVYKRQEAAKVTYDAQLAACKNKGKKGRKGNKPQLKHYYVGDTTTEALIDVLGATPRGIIQIRDELTGWMEAMNQYRSGSGDDRQVYMQLFDNTPVKKDRKGAGPKYAAHPGLSILGGVQNRIMPKVFREKSIDEGLLPRFIMVCVDRSEKRLPEEGIREDDRQYWEELVNWCYEVPLLMGDDGAMAPHRLTLEKKAWRHYNKYIEWNHYLSRYLPEQLQAFIPKLDKYCLKLAGIIHCLKAHNAGKRIADMPEIDAETIDKAVALTKYFGGQAVKLLEQYGGPQGELRQLIRDLIDTLQKLHPEVKRGRLQVKRITEVLNAKLPMEMKQTARAVSGLLKELGLTTKPGAGNLAVLLWEPDLMIELFQRVTLPTLTSLTADEGEEAPAEVALAAKERGATATLYRVPDSLEADYQARLVERDGLPRQLQENAAFMSVLFNHARRILLYRVGDEVRLLDDETRTARKIAAATMNEDSSLSYQLSGINDPVSETDMLHTDPDWKAATLTVFYHYWAGRCSKCRDRDLLYFGHQDRRRAPPIFHKDPNPEAEIMFIGEAPNKSASLDPNKGYLTIGNFGDPAGEFMSKLLMSVGLTYEKDTIFTNIALCLPKKVNDDYLVTTEQVELCSPWLKLLMAIIEPKIVVTFGGAALEGLKQIERHTFSLNEHKGQLQPWYNRLLLPLYHTGRKGRIHRGEQDQYKDISILKRFDEIKQHWAEGKTPAEIAAALPKE